MMLFQIENCVVANVLVCNIRVRKFKLQSCNRANFQTKILEKGMNPPSPPCNRLNSTSSILQEECKLFNTKAKD